MRYIIRSLKYLVFISVLYVILTAVMTYISYPEVDLWMMLKVQMLTERGIMLVVALVLLSLFYPRFGFMSRTVANCTFANDVVRIDNAMALYGFELEREEGGIRYYRAKGFFRRLTFFYEDRVEVREAEGVVVIEGIRRAVARIAFQLEAYIHNSRFEEK